MFCLLLGQFRYGFMVTASSPSSLRLLTPTCKLFNGGLKKTIYLVTWIPFVKIQGQRNTFLESSIRLAKRKRYASFVQPHNFLATENHWEAFPNISCWSWQLKGFEFVRAVHLDPVPFDMERDLITPTYKKKRPQLLKYYQVDFELEIFLLWKAIIIVIKVLNWEFFYSQSVIDNMYKSANKKPSAWNWKIVSTPI